MSGYQPKDVVRSYRIEPTYSYHSNDVYIVQEVGKDYTCGFTTDKDWEGRLMNFESLTEAVRIARVMSFMKNKRYYIYRFKDQSNSIAKPLYQGEVDQLLKIEKDLHPIEVPQKYPQNFEKIEKIQEPVNKFKVLDLNNELLGETLDLIEANKIFLERYPHFQKDMIKHFIEEI